MSVICSVCSQEIKNYYYLDFYKNPYCTTHAGQIPKCFSCGRIISQKTTRGAMLHKDGRAICNICRQTAVTHPQQAEQAANEVKKLLARITLDVTRHSIPVRLAAWDEMCDLNKCNYAERPIGLAVSTYSGNHRFMKEIIILSGLSRLHFSSVYAHEMSHAWMWLNHYPELEPWVKEGLCNLFAYLWLRQQHSPESMYLQHMLLQDQDKVYGNGFRLAKVKFSRHRLIRLLDYVKTHQRFPD